MKKVLVTGASGFIGSTLCDMLLRKEGVEVWAGVRKNSSRKYLQSQELHFMDLQYSEPDVLKEQLEKESFDTIFHLAGLTKAKSQEEFDKVNFVYTKNLIYAIKDLECKLIYMSSFAAHGPAGENPFTIAKVSDKNTPNTMYGKSKLKAEEYINDHCTNKYIILRPTGVYGEREKDYFVYFKTIKSHIDATLGKPKQRLTFIYSKDLCKACILAAENRDLTKKTYFVADGNVYLDSEFSQITKQVFNTWTISIRFPLWIVRVISSFLDNLGRVIGKQFTLNKDKYNLLAARNWECDIENLKKDLGFEADYDLKRGVQEAIAWYKKEKWL
ncbi:MAG: NAD(P)-dependent oxidoreductase [Bacteroidota bacterium]|nr:NAD(P)-dependent oxidoreductase [Bacteroidota bacterium]